MDTSDQQENYIVRYGAATPSMSADAQALSSGRTSGEAVRGTPVGALRVHRTRGPSSLFFCPPPGKTGLRDAIGWDTCMSTMSDG